MRALKHFSHREWAVLRDLWLDHLPTIEFDAQYPGPTLWQLPRIQYPTLNASGTAEFPYAAGIREAIFREAVILWRKFAYCCTILRTLSDAGKNTWTSVAAYEACFYGAKAFCYLLGFASSGRDSKLFLDAFYQSEQRIGKVRTKVYELIRVHNVGDRLTHEVLWALTARLVDTTKFEGELRDVQTELKLTDWDSLSRFRNKIYYDGSFWPFSDDIAVCDLTRSVPHPEMIIAASLDDNNGMAPFAEEYFILARLLRQTIAKMLRTIADVAPAIEPEATLLA